MRDYTNYNTSHTFAYKSGYIHTAYFGNEQVTRVSLDEYSSPIEVKSVLAAKQAITRHINQCTKARTEMRANYLSLST